MSGTRRKPGRLGPFVEDYRAWLSEREYTPGTTRNMLKELGVLGRWMTEQSVEPGRLDAAAIGTFLAARRAARQRRVPSLRAMHPLVSFLREAGVMVPDDRPEQLTPLERFVAEYRDWLVGERGLAETTVIRYERLAHRFMAGRVADAGGVNVAGLTGADVSAFLLQECARVSVGSAKGRTAELRSLLRFLYLRRFTDTALADSVPSVAGWRNTEIPATMPPADVERLLGSCERSTLGGARNYAIMLLLARLGLRSIEVARLQLEDLDWRAGELVVRGKARRHDRLPLPADVGDALAGYLSLRGKRHFRHVFLTVKAPTRPIRAELVGDVVQRASLQAGVAHVGAHRLRHTFASELLRAGASIVDISQLLRHSDLATTAGYAKVDLGRLRQVARPWPGANAMSALARHLDDYLRLRRMLGHKLDDAARQLPWFVEYLDATDNEYVTVTAALTWALDRDWPAGSTVPGHRMTAVRGFARYLAGIDPRTEVPPPGLVRIPRTWRPPFIYTDDDVLTLMDAARRSIREPLRAATYETLLGLLASTGLRIGEALRLDRDDIDEGDGVLLIRRSKFGKSRQVALQPSALEALACYQHRRRQLYPHPKTDALFVSLHGTRVIYECVWPTFRRLCDQARIGDGAPDAPTLHDFRHSFAVRTLLDWYRAGVDVQARLAWLSTYLGHGEPRYTYSYLSAAPELLAHAARLVDDAQAVRR